MFPGDQLSAPTRNHGIRNRKKLAGMVALIGMEFENAPLPSSTPVVLTVQFASGVNRFVEVTSVYPRFGVPPVPRKIRLVPESVGPVSDGGMDGGRVLPCNTISA